MKKLLSIFIIFIFTACSNSKILEVKYRDTPVNVNSSNFEYLNTKVSTFIDGAWYDSSNNYMIINLTGVNYHYCLLPQQIWENFKETDSFGKYYNANIKGNYDCRESIPPAY